MTAARLDATSFYFGAADRPLLGWYHPPSESTRRPSGVVLCNPIGDDLTRAHRALRHLAERLSEAGFSVLRFDFHGTGDSSGDEREPDRVKTWIEDIALATRELRARSGAKEVSLAGLRLGGTLAMVAAAEQGEVDSLVLWGAYESGDAFVAEVTKVHKMHTQLEPASFSGGPRAPFGEEALGFFLTDATIQELGRVDQLALRRRPARRVLVIGTSNVPAESRMIEHLRGLEADVAYRHLPGNKFLMTTPQHATVPHEIIDSIVAWLSELYPIVHHEQSASGVANWPPTSHVWGERPVFFGSRHRLFGILHRPSPDVARSERSNLAAPRGDLPGIIMLNAGCVHRMGAHRLYVQLARRWARLGFSVLRLDLSGIGDSPAADGCEENLTYPRDRLHDVEEAMAYLRVEASLNKFILIGLCSGADIAFQLGFKGSGIAGVVMMNPRTFCVHDLTMVDAHQHARWYQRSLARGASWKKLLRGDVNLLFAARRVAPKVMDAVKISVKHAMDALESLRGHAEDRSEARRENDVPVCLRRMAEQGVDTFLLVTEHDPGVDYVDANYGRGMKGLSSVRGFRRTDIKGTDHTFTALWAQQRVSDMITDHFRRRYAGV